MVSDAPAQAAQVAAQDDPVASDQAPPSVSLAPVLPASTPDAQPASESVTPDYSSFDGIRKATETNKALRDYLERQRLDTANAERQRLQNEMRREQGSAERANAYHRDLIDRLNNGEDPQTIARDTPLFVKANQEWATVEVLRALGQQAIELATPDEQSALRSLLDEADSGEAVTKVTGHILDVLAKRTERQTREALTPETLYESDPRFKEWVDARAQQHAEHELEAEMTAQRTEQNARGVAPSTPTGSPPASTSDEVERIIEMPEADRNAYMLDLAMNNPEEFERIEKLLYEASGLRMG